MNRTLLLLCLLSGFTLSFSPVSPSNHDGNGPEDCVKFGQRSFFVGKTEVSVGEYNDFLKGLIDEGKAHLVSQYAPDPEVWMRTGGSNAPLRDNYFSHKAFYNYPVLGVSHEAAIAFCEWKTRKALADGEKNLLYRLPTKKEWEMVAHAGKSDALYPGGAFSFRTDEGKYRFNHRVSKENFIDDNFEYTAPVTRYGNKPLWNYPENASGLYHIAGNVAEMVAEPGIAKGGSWLHYADEARIDHDMTYEAPTAWVGFRYVAVVE